MSPHDLEAPSQRFTRRQLLQHGAILAAAAGIGGNVLAACGGSASPSSSASASAGGSVAGTVSFFSWQGYDLLDIPAMQSWCKKNHVVVKSNYISTSDDVTAKFTTGGGKGVYNLSTYSAGFGPFYASINISTPLDLSRVPNFKKAYPFFQTGPSAEMWWLINGKQLALPFTWGLMGANYDSEKTKAPTSYLDLLQPQYKNKIGIVDDLNAAMVIGAHVKGIFRTDSLYTPAQVDQILSYWYELKKNVRTIIPSYGNMADQFVSGEIVVGVPGWSAVNSFAAAKGDTAVMHTLPKEGAVSFVDGFFVPPQAPDVDTMYAWVNQAFDPEVQAQTAEYLVQGAVIPEAVPLMNKEAQKLSPYDQIGDILSNSAPLDALPIVVPDGYANWEYWNKAWTTFKAS